MPENTLILFCLLFAAGFAHANSPFGVLEDAGNHRQSALQNAYMVNVFHDKEAEAFARDAIRQICRNWDTEDFLKLLHSRVSSSLSRDSIEKTMFAFKTFGAFVEFKTFSFNTSIADSGIAGLCMATIQCEHAEVTVSAQTIRNGGEWALLSLVITSPGVGAGVVSHADSRPDLTGISTNEAISLLQTEDLVLIRRNKDAMRQMLLNLPGGDEPDGMQNRYFRLYLQAVPRDLEIQLELCRRLSVSIPEESDERLKRLRFVARVSENTKLREEAYRHIGVVPASNIPVLSANSTNRVDILLIPLGDFDRYLADEIAAVFQEQMQIQVAIWNDPLPLPSPDRIYKDEFVTAVFTSLTNSLSPLQVQSLLPARQTGGVLPLDDMIAGIRAYLQMQNSSTAQVEAFSSELDRLEGRIGFTRTSLADYMSLHFPYLKGRAVAYVGLLAHDLYDSGAENMYGGARGAYGIVSTYLFSARPEDDVEDRPRLVERMVKQLMSTSGTTLGLARCNTPDCPRAFPNSVSEHDVKKLALCEDCRQALKMHRDSGYAAVRAGYYYRKACEYYADNEYEETIRLLRQTIDMHQLNDDAYGLLAQCLYKQETLTAALDACNQINGAAAKLRAYSALVHAVRQSSDLKDIVMVYRHALANGCVNYLFLVGLVETLCNLDDAASARATMDEWLDDFEDEGERYEAEGACRLRMRDYSGAAVAYSRAIAKGNRTARSYTDYGYCMRKLGMAEMAESLLARAIEQNSSYVNAYFSLAHLIEETQGDEKALPYFQRIIVKFPDNADAYNSTGYTLYRLGRYDEALNVYREGLARDPAYGLMHMNRALALLKLNRTSEAISAYDTARSCGYKESNRFESIKASRILAP